MRTFLATWKRPGEVAIRAAVDHSNRQPDSSLLDCIEQGLIAAEEHPEMIAIGRGSLPNTDGEIELDASCMRGDTLQAGAVCGIRGILPCISIARAVMEKTPHVMLQGEQARRFALELGMTPQNLMTEEVIRRYQEFLKRPLSAPVYVHSSEDEPPHDTVTMLGFEDGHFVAASSTSGMPWKMPGRVGDSPIIGAGIYADDEVGCAGATGQGEELWKAVASFRVVEFMRNGASAQEACSEVIQFMLRRQPASADIPCVVLALDRNGNFGAAVTKDEFQLWVARDDDIERHDFHPTP